MDELDVILNREEHTQGLRYGDSPDHCDRCLTAWLAANCTHSVTVEITQLGDLLPVVMCVGCGRRETVAP